MIALSQSSKAKYKFIYQNTVDFFSDFMIVTTRSLLLRIRHMKIHLCASEANKNAFESLSTLISGQHLFVCCPAHHKNNKL